MGYKKGDVLRTAFDSYTIQGQKGSGGSGTVFEILDSEGAPYAAKVLDATKATPSRLRRFRNEIHFCTINKHRNIVRIHGSGVSEGGDTFYIMPLYSETLRRVMANGIPPQSVLPYFGQILDGIEAAHLQGVWHRDVKPENILFSAADDLFVIADFGIAHFEEESLLTAVETRDGERLANFLYSAPEQKVRGQPADAKADVYALGLILNEMFSREVPLGTSPRRVSDAAPQYAYLDGLIDLMLRQDPRSRPTVTEVKRELIARGNDFLCAQRISSLKSEVVPETVLDDPIVRQPIRIVSKDFRNGNLIFELSAVPPPNWVAAFYTPIGSYSSYPGAGPRSFSFAAAEASVALGPGMSVKTLAGHAESYVELANRQYASSAKKEHEKRLAHDREQLRKRIAEEERRQKILRELNG